MANPRPKHHGRPGGLAAAKRSRPWKTNPRVIAVVHNTFRWRDVFFLQPVVPSLSFAERNCDRRYKTTRRHKRSAALCSASIATFLTAIIALGLSSCAQLPVSDNPAPTSVSAASELPLRVAVLPFVNRTTNPEAADIVRKMFYNFFSSLNYLDMEPSMIDAKLAQHGLTDRLGTGQSVSPLKLGRLLEVDAVVFGEVTSLGKLFALVYTDNEAGLKARMVSCTSEKAVWEMEHTIHQREGEVPLSITGLAASIIKTAISHQQATHVQAAAELCMQMIATVPNPPAVSEPPPKIQVLVHNAGGLLMQPGDRLKVVIVGDRGLHASWSLAPLIRDEPLEEIRPGVYIGAYDVKKEDCLYQGRIIGSLQSAGGVRSQWVDTFGQINIGAPTVLPAAVTKDTVLTSAGGPYLVREALVVMPSASLIIEPGTVIWFERLGIVVRGELRVLGTAESPVQLGSIAMSAWKGIFFDHSKGENVLQHCTVSGAQYGLRSISSDVSVSRSHFRDNVWGIVAENGRLSLNRTRVRTSVKNGIAARKADVNVSESIISENGTGGVLLENSSARISENNIANNANWQLKVVDTAGAVKADGNWWGRKQPTDADIVGSVRLGTVLDQPLDFSSNPTTP